MKHEQCQLVLFTGGGYLLIWLDILIGHVGGEMRNLFMWVPVVILPVAAVMAILTSFHATPLTRTIFYTICWIVILTGISGFCFHLLRLTTDLKGQIQWEVLVRLMRYPPLLAPLSLCGLGILGVLVNRGKVSRQNIGQQSQLNQR